MAAPSRPRSLLPWLGLAASVHALIWVAWRERTSSLDEQPSHDAVSEMELELLPLDEPRPLAVVPPAPAPLEPEVPPVSSRPRTNEGGSSQAGSSNERNAAVSSPTPVEGVEQVASDKEPSLAAPESGQATPTVVPQASATAGASSSPPASVSPADRLAALGYGAPNAAALKPYLDVSPTVLAEERLNQHLVQAIVDDDRDHSLGIEGPVTNALHTGAMSVVVPKSLSKVAITIGRDGKLADFRIIETNRDARALKALGERVKNLLANQTVRVPNGHAMEFIYEIRSDVLLPSGRAPGLGVDVLGLPVKKAPDEKSSKISILTPTLEFKSQSLPDPDHKGKIKQTPPQLVYGKSLLGLDADPVDIGANARQVVRTRLIRQRVL